MLNDKFKKLLKISARVIEDVSLPNGAIVAANTDHKYYPRSAKDYRYVWPRDAAFICIALDYLNNANQSRSSQSSDGTMSDGAERECEPDCAGRRELTRKLNIQERYFSWLNEYPEDFKKEGLLLQNYSANGRKYQHQFQPDQIGISLWAIWHHFKDDLSAAMKFEPLIMRLADGICNDWKRSYFFTNTHDLWEDRVRMTSTKIENNFTYSLAACAGGLEKALLLFPHNESWEATARQMEQKIDEAYLRDYKFFSRNHGKIDDLNTDASLLGLVWPFEIIDPKDKRIVNTVKRMEEKIVVNGGVRRFEMDYYDGEGTAAEGAGAWPLLNFWMAIYWHLAGNNRKAKKYFNWVIEKLDKDCFMPEQIFCDFRDGNGIKPLAWSHAMFISAYYILMDSAF